MLKNNFVIFVLVAFILVDSNLANLKNLLMTTKVVASSCHNGRNVVKSIETPLKGQLELKGLI
jgi:hypothetical protein